MAAVVCGTCTFRNATGYCRIGARNVAVAADATCGAPGGLTNANIVALLKQTRLVCARDTTSKAINIVSITSACEAAHWVVTYTVDGGPERTAKVGIDEITEGPEGSTVRSEVCAAMKAMALMTGVHNFAGAQFLLVGQTFWAMRGDDA